MTTIYLNIPLAITILLLLLLLTILLFLLNLFLLLLFLLLLFFLLFLFIFLDPLLSLQITMGILTFGLGSLPVETTQDCGVAGRMQRLCRASWP